MIDGWSSYWLGVASLPTLLAALAALYALLGPSGHTRDSIRRVQCPWCS